MKIIGFSLNKISGERANSVKGSMEIKSNLNIEDIKSEEIPISDKKGLKFDFAYGVDYSSDTGKLEIKGSVLAIDDKDEAKEILKDWKKKKFDHSVKLPLFNFILDKCNLKSLQIEEDLGLPMHIPFPKLTPAQKENKNPANYTG